MRTRSEQLQTEYGPSFSEKNVRRMMQFAGVFPDEQIVVSLIRQLSWTHILAVILIEDPLKWEFYIQICRKSFALRGLRQAQADSQLDLAKAVFLSA
jgi:hypothetical protein